MEQLNATSFSGIVLRSILKNLSNSKSWEITNRRSHGLIIKVQGSTNYTFGNQFLQLSNGEILFVRKGSSYSIQSISSGYSYVVNFDCDVPGQESYLKLPLPPDVDITQTAEKMYHRWQKENVYGTLSILYSIMEKTSKNALRRRYSSPRERQLLEPVIAYLKEHLTDSNLRLDVLPQLADVSDAYLRRVFKRQYGTAPAGYVIQERIRLAKQLLLSDEGHRITQVAAKVGYHDPLYFSRLFKKQTGLSPTEYTNTYKDTLF